MSHGGGVDEEPRTARARIVGSRRGVLADGLVGAVRAWRAVRAVLSRALSRVVGPVTGAGAAVAVCAVLALVAGYVLGWREALPLGWALVAALVLAAGHLLGSGRFAARLALPGERTVAGRGLSGALVVENRGRRVRAGTLLEVPVGEDVLPVRLPALAARARHDETFAVSAARRGVLRVGPVSGVRGDPFGLMRTRVRFSEAVELYVHPRTVAFRGLSSGFVRDLEGAPTRDLTSSDISFHALREYLPGDERRSIHWKSTAKSGRLMVRQYEQTRRSHLLVALSLASGDYADDGEFELGVSAAASLGVRAIRDARTVSVLVSEKTGDYAKRTAFASRRIPTVSPRRLLDSLTLVEPSAGGLPLGRLARLAADAAADVSLAFLVCGSPVGHARLRAAAAHFPVGASVVAVVCDRDRTPGRTRLGGLTVLTVGSLEELAKSLGGLEA